jgi:hypothetical protein
MSVALQRRQIQFATLDEAVRDAENLLARGYDKTGNWDLGQICNHLAEWLKYPMDGYPRVPLLLRPVFWLMKATVGKRMGRQMVEGGTMKTGMQTAPQSVFPPGGDAAAVANYRATVERWKAYAGPYHPSPLFGGLGRADWDRGHCVHAAHHLSFLVPRSN